MAIILCADEYFIEYSMQEKETVSCYLDPEHEGMHSAWSRILDQEVYWE